MIYPPSQKPPIWSIDPGVLAYNCQKAGMPHPVLAMPMWGGAGNRALDYSGHGNHGTLTNGSKWTTGGIGFDETANDSILLGTDELLKVHGKNEFSIVAGVRWTETAQSDEYTIWGNWDYPNGGTNLRIEPSNNSLEWHTQVEGEGAARGGNFTDLVLTNDGSKLDIIVAVFTSTNMKAYLNGKVSSTIYATGNTIETTPTTTNIYLGRSPHNTSDWFNGTMEFITKYNTALSASQAKFIRNNPYFMYQIPEELYGYVAAAPPSGNPFWYYNMLRRRN